MLIKRSAIATAVVALGIGCAGTAFAADAMSREAYKAEKDRIEAEYKAAKEKCDKLSGNAEDVCQVQAKGTRRIAEAELDARNKNTPRAQEDVKKVRADVDYDVAKEKCDDLAGNAKDSCQKDAKAVHARAVSNVRASSPGPTTAADTTRCDRLTGDARAACLADARAKPVRP
jgi:hypothetical protein